MIGDCNSARQELIFSDRLQASSKMSMELSYNPGSTPLYALRPKGGTFTEEVLPSDPDEANSQPT